VGVQYSRGLLSYEKNVRVAATVSVVPCVLPQFASVFSNGERGLAPTPPTPEVHFDTDIFRIVECERIFRTVGIRVTFFVWFAADGTWVSDECINGITVFIVDTETTGAYRADFWNICDNVEMGVFEAFQSSGFFEEFPCERFTNPVSLVDESPDFFASREVVATG
jgi:hypothetical protein